MVFRGATGYKCVVLLGPAKIVLTRVGSSNVTDVTVFLPTLMLHGLENDSHSKSIHGPF